MEIKILDKIENPLLNRTEIKAEVLHQGEPTPKRGDVRKLLAAQTGAEENVVVVRQLDSVFGVKSKLIAMIYKDRAQLEKLEPKHIIGREIGQKKKPGAKKAVAKAA